MLIALGIVLLLLPVLGYMGAFKAIKTEYNSVVEVQLPPPPPEPKAAQAKKAHPRVARRGGEHIPGSRAPLPVHVAAVAPSASSSSDQDDNSVVNGSNTNIGTVPVAPPAKPSESATAPVQPVVSAAPPTQPVQAVAPTASAAAIPDQDAAVIPSTEVKPVIPDDLRDSDLDTKFYAQFIVHPDGTADVKMTDSTGNNELDQLALQAARQWRFQPSIREGKPVESYLRLEVEFQVS